MFCCKSISVKEEPHQVEVTTNADVELAHSFEEIRKFIITLASESGSQDNDKWYEAIQTSIKLAVSNDYKTSPLMSENGEVSEIFKRINSNISLRQHFVNISQSQQSDLFQSARSSLYAFLITVPKICKSAENIQKGYKKHVYSRENVGNDMRGFCSKFGQQINPTPVNGEQVLPLNPGDVIVLAPAIAKDWERHSFIAVVGNNRQSLRNALLEDKYFLKSEIAIPNDEERANCREWEAMLAEAGYGYDKDSLVPAIDGTIEFYKILDSLYITPQIARNFELCFEMGTTMEKFGSSHVISWFSRKLKNQPGALMRYPARIHENVTITPNLMGRMCHQANKGYLFKLRPEFTKEIIKDSFIKRAKKPKENVILRDLVRTGKISTISDEHRYLDRIYNCNHLMLEVLHEARENIQ